MFDFKRYTDKDFPHQQHRLMRKIPNVLLKPLVDDKMLIAGGAVASVFSDQPIKDFDLYPLRYSSWKSFDEKMKSLVTQKQAELLFSSGNADTYKVGTVVVQLIKKLVSNNISKEYSPEEVLGQFDFTVCMGGFRVDKGEFILNSQFLPDLAARRLVYNSANPTYPICSIYRVLKYEKKGFSIAPGELVKLCLCICNLQMDTYYDLKDQLMGIDTLIFEELTNDLIRCHGENAKIDYGVVMERINEKLSGLWESEEYKQLKADEDENTWVW